jgi:hypothetical protein
MQRAINEKDLKNLRARLRGDPILPGNRHYEHARRVWNGRIDKYPALVVRCADLTDVLTALPPNHLKGCGSARRTSL